VQKEYQNNEITKDLAERAKKYRALGLKSVNQLQSKYGEKFNYLAAG